MQIRTPSRVRAGSRQRVRVSRAACWQAAAAAAESASSAKPYRFGYALNAATSARGAASDWAEGTPGKDNGASRDYYNRAGQLEWHNKMGDWRDARAAVTKDIPANAVAVGIPAKVIRYRWKNAGGDHALEVRRQAKGSGALAVKAPDPVAVNAR